MKTSLHVGVEVDECCLAWCAASVTLFNAVTALLMAK